MTPNLEVLANKKKQGGYHLGKMILDFFLERPPDGICQIDAATEEQETYSSVLSRSVRLARRLRRDGFRAGDVLMLGGQNHLDIHVPFYAAHFNGQPVVGVDPFYRFDEIKQLFNITKPKIAFCQHETYEDYSRAAKELGLDVKIVTFDGGECPFRKYLEEYEDEEPIEHYFKAADFDIDSVFAWLVSTSGTSGVPKVAAFTHRTLVDMVMVYMNMGPTHKDSQIRLNISPVQWISAYFNSLSVIMNETVLQTSKPAEDLDHVIDIINKYKARMSSKAVLMEAYGQTESLGVVLGPNPAGPLGSCGVPIPLVKIKLVDPESGKEITEPNVTGELWTKGPRFACYYNNPEETAKAITEDGWYRTGDLLYRDENNNYFYVDRLSMLIKYRGHHVEPPEVEEVITAHPEVQEVGVTGIPHPEDGEHAVACVVLRPGSSLTAQDIKKIVADKLSAVKRLHGGVVFMAELPKTSTGKVARGKLKKMVLNLNRE